MRSKCDRPALLHATAQRARSHSTTRSTVSMPSARARLIKVLQVHTCGATRAGLRGSGGGKGSSLDDRPPIQSSGVRFPPQSSGAHANHLAPPIQSSGIPSTNHLAPIIWRTRVRVANRLAFLKTNHLVLNHSSGFKRVRRELDSRFNQTTLDPRTSYRDAEPPTPGRNHLRLRTGPCNGNSSG